MGYDYEDDLSHTERPVRQTGDLSSNYLMALAVWFGPPIVIGMLLFGLNVWSYDTTLSGGDEFMQTEQRRICGWPFMLAWVVPATQRWALCKYGVVLNGLVALAAIAITSGTCRFVAACFDDDVNRPFSEQMRRLLRARTTRAPQRSGPSGPNSAAGRARIRRANRRQDR